jgi:hypothetical protein
MKLRTLCIILSVLWISSCFSGAFAQEKPAAELKVQKVKPGNLDGIISDSEGKKLAGKKVMVLDKEGNVVSSTVSNKYGMYQFKDLPEGEYTLKAGEDEIARLHVTKDATVSSLKIVTPPAGSMFTPLQWSLIGVGGAAVAVGVPVALSGGGSSSHGVPPLVSP